MLAKIRAHLTYARFIGIGFLTLILFGAFLLTLPISSRTGEWSPFVNSLFTSTSATCVTGLVVYDTFSHWSLFGQIVIISLIQIGGIGFMTIVTMVSMFIRRQIGLRERQILMQSAGNTEMGGTVRLIIRMVKMTLICEGIGTFLLAIRFCPEMGFAEGLYNAVFHAVSAFCNAGFDLMGKYGQFSSLTRYAGDPLVVLTICSLIIVGGLGFLVLNDLMTCRFSLKKIHLNSKIVLCTTAVLLVGGTTLLFLFENDKLLAGMSFGKKFLISFFQAVTPRTAGFNVVEISAMSESSSLLSIVLMFIGGSPGSTAGGIKTTTVFVLTMAIIASAHHRIEISVFKRKLETYVVRQACAVASVYMFAVIASTLAICAMLPFSMKDVLFEVVSAIGTVGMTTGITPLLNTASKLIIILLMFGGRIGVLSFMLMFAERNPGLQAERPVEKILIG